MVYIKIDAEGRLTAVAGHGFHIVSAPFGIRQYRRSPDWFPSVFWQIAAFPG